MSEKYTPVLVFLLILSSFAIGSMWTKIQYLQAENPKNIVAVNQATGAEQKNQPAVQQAQKVAPKADKPTVELFVMSYCPYGLQTQKAIVPVLELLGSKINASIKWVSYAMHGQKEVEENLRQYCIQKEQSDKYLSYLRCFVSSNNTEDCQKKAGINSNKLQTCFDNSDSQFGIMKAYNDKASWLSGQYPKFSIDEALNTKYSVRGSPSLVINGQLVDAPRSAEEMKKAICAAFNKSPAECQKTLSTGQEKPGAGEIGLAYNATAATGTAGCQ